MWCSLRVSIIIYNSELGFGNVVPWIFVVLFSFADSTYFGCTYLIIYNLTPLEFETVVNSNNIAFYIISAMVQSEVFDIIAENTNDNYDYAFLFQCVMIAVGLVCQMAELVLYIYWK